MRRITRSVEKEFLYLKRHLDPATAGSVFELMLALNEQLGSTLVVVTHSLELAARFPRRLRLQNGTFEEA